MSGGGGCPTYRYHLKFQNWKKSRERDQDVTLCVVLIKSDCDVGWVESKAKQHFSKNILLRRVEFGSNTTDKFQMSNFSVVFASQIPNSTLHRGMFMIKTHTSFNWKICGIWAKFSQILSGDFGWRVVLMLWLEVNDEATWYQPPSSWLTQSMTAYALIFINFPADATLDEVKHHCQSLPSTPTSWMRSHTDRITVIIFTNISHFTLRKLKNEREKGRKVSVENGKKLLEMIGGVKMGSQRPHLLQMQVLPPCQVFNSWETWVHTFQKWQSLRILLFQSQQISDNKNCCRFFVL